METHGLRRAPADTGDLPPLRVDQPALRVELRTLAITEVNGPLAELVGTDAALLRGRSLASLWPPPERAAIARRFEDVVLLGEDVFGALALSSSDRQPIWVEVDARFCFDGRPRLEIALRPLSGPARMAVPAADGAPDADASAADVASRALADVLALPPPQATPNGRADAQSGDDAPPADDDNADDDNAVAPPAAARPPSVVMAVLEAAGASALAVTTDGRVASATPEVERLLGTPIARLRGARFTELFALPEPAADALASARRDGMRQSVLADVVDSDMRVVLEWVPADEADAGYAVLVGNVPESEASERLRLQARLVAFVAHDVRESLDAVYAGLRTLSNELPPEAPQRSTVERTLSESRRANRIVDDVLAVSRPGRLTRVELDLGVVLHDTLLRFRAKAAAESVELHEELARDVRVNADLSSLERAFGNLVENGLDASAHGGTLTVRTQREDRARPGVRVSIADSGAGIAPDIRPNIFEPFVTDKAAGTGLGLAITRRVILDHDGQIDFETGQGRGTTFHIWLPRVT